MLTSSYISLNISLSLKLNFVYQISMKKSPPEAPSGSVLNFEVCKMDFLCCISNLFHANAIEEEPFQLHLFTWHHCFIHLEIIIFLIQQGQKIFCSNPISVGKVIVTMLLTLNMGPHLYWLSIEDHANG